MNLAAKDSLVNGLFPQLNNTQLNFVKTAIEIGDDRLVNGIIFRHDEKGQINKACLITFCGMAIGHFSALKLLPYFKEVVNNMYSRGHPSTHLINYFDFPEAHSSSFKQVLGEILIEINTELERRNEVECCTGEKN